MVLYILLSCPAKSGLMSNEDMPIKFDISSQMYQNFLLNRNFTRPLTPYEVRVRRDGCHGPQNGLNDPETEDVQQ